MTKADDKTAQNQQLTDLRQAEAPAAAYQESLAQERARNQLLEEQLAARRDATPGREPQCHGEPGFTWHDAGAGDR